MTTPNLRLALVAMIIAAVLVAATTPTKTYHCPERYDDEPIQTHMPRRDFGKPIAPETTTVPARNDASVR